MTVTHGADTGQLRSIAAGLIGQAGKLEGVAGDLSGSWSLLATVWEGADAYSLVWDRRAVTGLEVGSASLMSFARCLLAEADEQEAASGTRRSFAIALGTVGASVASSVPAPTAVDPGTLAKRAASAAPLTGRGIQGFTGTGDSPLDDQLGEDQTPTDTGNIPTEGDIKVVVEGDGDIRVTGEVPLGAAKLIVTSVGRITTEDGTTTYHSRTETGGSVQVDGTRGAAEGSVSAKVVDYVDTTVEVPEGSMTDEALAQVTPFNPLALPVDGVMTIEHGRSSTASAEGSFRFVYGAVELNQTDSSSMIVERTGEQTLRVTVGDEESARQLYRLGVGRSDFHIAGGLWEVNTQGTAAQLEFDMTVPEAVEAYNHLVATGELPADGTPGVTTPTIMTMSSTAAGFQLHAEAPTGHEIALHDTFGYQHFRGEATYPDGSTETQYVSVGDHGSRTVVISTGADGVETTTYHFTRDGISASEAEALGQLDPPVIAQEGDTVTFVLDDEEMRGLPPTNDTETREGPMDDGEVNARSNQLLSLTSGEYQDSGATGDILVNLDSSTEDRAVTPTGQVVVESPDGTVTVYPQD